MFKFYRDGSERRQDNVIGHDRFCQQRVAVPRYRRRRPPSHKRTQAEIETAFQLASMSMSTSTGVAVSGSGDSSIYNSTTVMYRSASELHCPKVTENPLGNDNSTITIGRDGDIYNSPLRTTNVRFQQNTRGYLPFNQTEEEESSSCFITRFFSSIAATLSCRQGRKTSVKYDPNTDPSASLQYEYSRLGDEVLNSSITDQDEAFIDISPGIIRLEKAAGHRMCMKYLESTNGRYVLIDHLPDIGWRTNRLWYLVSDSTVRAERLLTITPCNPKTQCVNDDSVKTIVQACQALQHPYVCPILDIQLIDADAFGKQFIIIVAPVVSRGSLRDIFHRSQWSDRWDLKYNIKKGGNGITEIQAQRLSCHILEALLELRLKGLPPGIGYHLHSGNVLIQHGTARFSALDNILFAHQPKKLPFIPESIDLESMDSISFAYMLFSMCSGYEVTSTKLTPANWNDILDYAQVLEVLDFILKNPEGRYPTLIEISQLDFYRTLDLRELRAPPPSSSLISGPSLSTVHFLVEYLKANRIRRGQKSKSICEIVTNEERGTLSRTSNQTSHANLNLVKRPYSSSTPSIPKSVQAMMDSSNVCPNHLPVSARHDASNTNTTHSSQLSVYWTPPNSLTFHILSSSPSTEGKESAT